MRREVMNPKPGRPAVDPPRMTRRALLATGLTGLATAAWSTPPVHGRVARWNDSRQYGPFLCHAAFSLERYQKLFDDLPLLERQLSQTLAIEPLRDVVPLFLFGDQASYRGFLRQRFPEVPYRRALYVKEGRHASVFAFRHSHMADDVRHECTHALLHASMPSLPLWLDEGIAEYFEVAPEDRACGHPHLAASRWSYRLGLERPIEALEDKSELGDMGSVDYRFSWAWVHFLLHGPYPAFHELVRYVRDVRVGNPAGIFSERLRRALPDVQRQIARHFDRWPSPSRSGQAACRRIAGRAAVS